MRRRSWPCQLPALVSATAAVCLLLSVTCGAPAFIETRAVTGTAPSPSLRRPRAQPSPSSMAGGSAPRATSTSSLNVAAFALLLMAGAVKYRGAFMNQRNKSTSRAAVVNLQWSAPQAAVPQSGPAALAALADPAALRTCSNELQVPLIDLDSEVPVICSSPEVQKPIVALQSPIIMASSNASWWAACEASEAENSTTCKPSPSAARFVGGSRRSSSHRRSTTGRAAASETAPDSCGRSARKAVGAKLMSKSSGYPASCHFAAYDASKIRAKIQVGLRNPCYAGNDTGREPKTPSCGIDVSDIATGRVHSHYCQASILYL
eukprot:TRINITY_DN11943_c0_g3_i1.p1 TRINITY_DN11943_c0_g3~~TRINITY_DN11943_c0_g3_i1.p1  ORF type:complete len:320 (-),score=64.12 TRINITY_DN11943_c0_g3_i1:417-1376(-)